eukprot:6028061-Pleurochrysis_carterae.AAC.2
MTYCPARCSRKGQTRRRGSQKECAVRKRPRPCPMGSMNQNCSQGPYPGGSARDIRLRRLLFRPVGPMRWD